MIRSIALFALAGLVSFPVVAEETGPPWSMADAYHDADEMAAVRKAMLMHHGAMRQVSVMADRLELQSSDAGDALVWDGNGWYGGDVDKLWLKSEGTYSLETDAVEDAEVQALWSHAISPYFDLQGGIRYDLEPKGRTHAVLGLQGLAPYWFEVDAAAFLSSEGDLTARIETEYEVRLTQRLILQPRVEAEFAAQDIPDLETGSGLTSLDAGLRLRYEFVREFAPYIGVEWQGSFGGTADYLEAAGEETDRTAFVAGVRTWF
ncbi:copper resistance protein B [Hyphomonas johnsonii]|uniref:Copper resistance protein B n=1 Tax=Hyphomonas johnsonii MHS-2 TaxID=1280950 RepID=A0A059FCG7_9PROT|nr:copper resistance protein B [Hyphomonas johnsonii]KCZ88319.1 copper resistance protein B [Hyphomonas johnsonii MHS-2]